MKKPSVKQAAIASAIVVLLGGAVMLMGSGGQSGSDKGGKEAGKSASAASSAAATPPAISRATLTVTTVKPQTADWPLALAANGNITAWQEAVVGSELGGLRLAEVLVNVGDVVQRGQVLARFAAESVAADVAQQEAGVEEANALLSEAHANAERARSLASSGALSAQQTAQYMTAERSAKARLQSAKARLQIDQIRLRQTQVVAPDDGVISSRSASVGTVAGQGLELFKLIRKGRLEWRAEVISSDLSRIKTGQTVHVLAANGGKIDGTVRMIAPTVDPVTRNAIVYVDLPQPGSVHAGMFASGQFDLGRASALTVPQKAVVTRDGFSYVFAVGADGKITQTKITLGRRVGERVEVAGGLRDGLNLVSQGGGFLADGDLVMVVAGPKKPAAASAAASAAAK